MRGKRQEQIKRQEKEARASRQQARTGNKLEARGQVPRGMGRGGGEGGAKMKGAEGKTKKGKEQVARGKKHRHPNKQDPRPKTQDPRPKTQDPRPKTQTQDGGEESKARDKGQEPARQQSKTYCQIPCIWVSVYNFCPFGHKKKIFETKKPNKDDRKEHQRKAKPPNL